MRAINGQRKGEQIGFQQRPLKILKRFLSYWLSCRYQDGGIHAKDNDDVAKRFLESHNMELQTIRQNKQETDQMAMEQDPYAKENAYYTITSMDALRRILAHNFYGRQTQANPEEFEQQYLQSVVDRYSVIDPQKDTEVL